MTGQDSSESMETASEFLAVGPGDNVSVSSLDLSAQIEMGKGARWFYRWFRVFALGLFKGWTRLSIEGVENVPPSGGFIFAPGGHRSLIDTPAAAVASPRLLRFMGAEKYFSAPGVGWALQAVGGFPVERSAADRASMRVAEELLRRGEPLVIFPEATRFEGPTVQPLKEGAAFLAARAGVPIVPVGFGGGERAWPKGKKLIRPKKMVIVIGKPLYPPERPAGGRVKRSKIKALTAELHTSLQSLFDEASSKAGV